MNAPQQPPRTALEQLLADEIARRADAQQHLADYAQQVVGVTPALHHRYICDELERGILNDEWDDCVVCLPPGGAKSTYASHCLPSWFLGHFPDNNVILASHTATLAEKWSRRVRDTVASPEHTRVFEHSTLSKDSTSVSKWRTSKNGEFLAAGVGMSILGFRADLAVLDDPVSGWEQAQSATQLEKIHNWFKADLKSRLKPTAKIIVICQRTAAYDMAGYVMKEFAENPTRRLRTIVLPMLAGEDDPLGRAPGERLWPHVVHARDGRRPAEGRVHLEDDVAAGAALGRRQLGDGRRHQDGGHRPRLALPVPRQRPRALGQQGRLQCPCDGRGRDERIGLRDRHVAGTDIGGRHRRQAPRTGRHVQPAGEPDRRRQRQSKVYVQLLANQARERGIPVPWKTMPMRGQDKETRAAPLRGMFKRGMIFFKRAPWNRWIVNELLIFPNAIGSGVDDGVDALSLIGRRLSSLARPAGEAPVQKPPPTVQEMTLAQLFEDNELKRGSRRRL